MTQEDRETIKGKILGDLEQLTREIGLLKEQTRPIEPDCSLGRLTRLEAMQEKEVCGHALQEARTRLNKLEYALRKVGEEGYGICIECEEKIAIGRLMIMPEASKCTDCAE